MPVGFDSVNGMCDSAALARPLRFVEKVRVLSACALAIALFVSVGWTAVAPADPHAPMTFLVDARAWPLAAGSIVAIAVVCSAVGTLIGGPAFGHVGVLATAVGLAIMSTRGGTMTQALIYHGALPADRKQLAPTLIADVGLWAIALMAAWLVAAMVARWIEGQTAQAVDENRTPVLARARDGLLGMIVAAAIAWIIITATIARTSASPVERGQVFFAVFLGFFAGTLAARYLWPKGAAPWYAGSVLLVAVIGYAWGYVSPQPSGGIATYYAALPMIPPNALFRPLPVEYVAVGVVGVLIGHRLAQQMHHSRKAARENA